MSIEILTRNESVKYLGQRISYVDHEYVSFLVKIYKDHKASVHTDVESNMYQAR